MDSQGLRQLPGVWPEGMKVPPRNEFSLVASEHSTWECASEPLLGPRACPGAPCCALGMGGAGLER